MLLNHFWNRSQHWQFEIFDWTECVPLSKVQITTAHTVLIKKVDNPPWKNCTFCQAILKTFHYVQ